MKLDQTSFIHVENSSNKHSQGNAVPSPYQEHQENIVDSHT